MEKKLLFFLNNTGVVVDKTWALELYVAPLLPADAFTNG